MPDPNPVLAGTSKAPLGERVPDGFVVVSSTTTRQMVGENRLVGLVGGPGYGLALKPISER